MKRLLLTVLLTVFASASLYATPFDFETTPNGPTQGALSITDGPVTMTVTTEGNANGWLVVGNSGVALVGKGVVGSQQSALQVNQFEPMRFTFSQLISDILFTFGDAGGDDDSPWTIRAYDAANNLLATNSGNYPAGFGAGMSSAFAGLSGAKYFVASSTPAFNPHSMFWDVKEYRVAQSVPEPTTLLLVGLGVIGVGMARKKIG